MSNQLVFNRDKVDKFLRNHPTILVFDGEYSTTYGYQSNLNNWYTLDVFITRFSNFLSEYPELIESVIPND